MLVYGVLVDGVLINGTLGDGMIVFVVVDGVLVDRVLACGSPVVVDGAVAGVRVDDANLNFLPADNENFFDIFIACVDKEESYFKLINVIVVDDNGDNVTMMGDDGVVKVAVAVVMDDAKLVNDTLVDGLIDDLADKTESLVVDGGRELDGFLSFIEVAAGLESADAMFP
ncbi:hypothetical protein NDU88_006484 [Pleurodeles waltl]|uniref:Uncharacterized protein n=1 Tax=Pleurodeles waltl TaxID=8319 RepID=A0AAV7TDN1_PLEWA|nr:hypothetical protein NDU88_006484 [Pleurodeles waltl]